MDFKEKYECFYKETKRLKRKMILHLAVVLGVVLLMIAVLVALYFLSTPLIKTACVTNGSFLQNGECTALFCDFEMLPRSVGASFTGGSIT